MHPTLKFTHEWSKTEINFLDLTLFKGKIFQNTQVLDMKCFSKPCDTDSNIFPEIRLTQIRAFTA